MKEFTFKKDLVFIKVPLECMRTLEWDYEEALNNHNGVITLLTKINHASACIHHSTRYVGGNAINCHPEFFPVISKMDYYDEGILSGRYKVILDNSLAMDEIIIHNNEDEDATYTHELIETKGEGEGDYGTLTFTPRLFSELTTAELAEYYKKRRVKIKILNYIYNE